MACVYIHKTLEGGVFYVGIGNSLKRAYAKTDRNIFWQRFTSRHLYVVEILFNNISREEASQIETYLIYYYGRRSLGTGDLVNFTDGDTYGKGYKHSIEALKKISKNNAKTKSKKVVDLSTGIIYNCLKDYAKEKNIKYGGIRAKLNGQNPNNTTLKYI